MANTLTGRVLHVSDVLTLKTRDGRDFSKRELVLDCSRYDPYTGERGLENAPAIEFIGDRMQMLDGLTAGMVVTVSIDILGRYDKVTERYYNTVRGYKVERRQQQGAGQVQTATQPGALAKAEAGVRTASVSVPGYKPQEVDDMPF